jgi:hypothetical protein
MTRRSLHHVLRETIEASGKQVLMAPRTAAARLTDIIEASKQFEMCGEPGRARRAYPSGLSLPPSSGALVVLSPQAR